MMCYYLNVRSQGQRVNLVQDNILSLCIRIMQNNGNYTSHMRDYHFLECSCSVPLFVNLHALPHLQRHATFRTSVYFVYI